MAGEEATTEVLVPMVAIISSCSRRSPVRGAEWANQLPIYLRGLAMLAAGCRSPGRKAGVASAGRAGVGTGADRRVHGGGRRRTIPARGGREEGRGCRAGAGGPAGEAAGHRG